MLISHHLLVFTAPLSHFSKFLCFLFAFLSKENLPKRLLNVNCFRLICARTFVKNLSYFLAFPVQATADFSLTYSKFQTQKLS